MGPKALALLFFVSPALAACPAGTVYESTFNKCYKYVSQGVNFLAAEKGCNSLGGTLVSVKNAFENSFISGIAGGLTPTPSFWIGANLIVSTQWSWTDGDNSTFLNWAVGQPSDPSMYQCGAIRDADNQWTKELCSTAKPYMCQIDPNAAPVNGCVTSLPTQMPSTATTNTPSPAGPCYCPNPTYTLNPATCKCYKYYGETSEYYATYNEAAQFCAAENSTLPVILSQADNSFVASFARNMSYATEPNPWIGLWCYGNTASSCQWVDGSPVNYTNFQSSYPYANQVAFLDETTERWYTCPSSYVGYVICQQPGMRTFEAPKLKYRAGLTNKTQQVEV